MSTNSVDWETVLVLYVENVRRNIWYTHLLGLAVLLCPVTWCQYTDRFRIFALPMSDCLPICSFHKSATLERMLVLWILTWIFTLYCSVQFFRIWARALIFFQEFTLEASKLFWGWEGPQSFSRAARVNITISGIPNRINCVNFCSTYVIDESDCGQHNIPGGLGLDIACTTLSSRCQLPQGCISPSLWGNIYRGGKEQHGTCPCQWWPPTNVRCLSYVITSS
jgi:hypothetical protein